MLPTGNFTTYSVRNSKNTIWLPGGRTVPELVRGGFGDLGALCLRVGVTAGPGGLGSWLVCRREHGLVHALGPGSGVGVFDASVASAGGVQ